MSSAPTPSASDCLVILMLLIGLLLWRSAEEITVRAPRVVALGDSDRRQAVTILAAMMGRR
jgi:hypothetical protein